MVELGFQRVIFFVGVAMFTRVLVVDDCEFTRRRLSKELRDEGYTVETANNGAEALAIIPEYQPDFVLTDWNMPIVDGKMLCQSLRSGNYRQNIYVILITAHSELMDVVQGLGAGADDYIVKPVNMPELLARMAAGARLLSLNSKLDHVAHHDPLTNVLNRRSLPAALSRIRDLSKVKAVPVSCIMLDIDRFKNVNDRYGHKVGDEALVRVAAHLNKRFRQDDFVFRYGGEEFLILLTDCNEADAKACAERCRADIACMTIETQVGPISLTASLGVAQLSVDEKPLKMIERADQALLQAKESGRDVVISYTSITASKAE